MTFLVFYYPDENYVLSVDTSGVPLWKCRPRGGRDGMDDRVWHKTLVTLNDALTYILTHILVIAHTHCSFILSYFFFFICMSKVGIRASVSTHLEISVLSVWAYARSTIVSFGNCILLGYPTHNLYEF